VTSSFARSQANRVVVVLALIVLLPTVAVVERVRRGAGQRLAIAGVRLVARVCGVRFEVRAQATMPPPGAIYAPNHSSPVDIPAMLLARPELCFLAAADLFKIPLLSGAMRALRTIPIDRRHTDVAHGQLDDLAAAERLYDIAIFPAGGIAPASGRLPFKTGAFVLAVRTGVPVVPVAIHGSADVLPPRGYLAVRPGTVCVELLEPVDTAGLTIEDRGDLRDRVAAAVVAALAGGPPPVG
jgi:1-acyl-sn-glycerol-3-phosphate acyltransferase